MIEHYERSGVCRSLHVLAQPVDTHCVEAPQDCRVDGQEVVVAAGEQVSLEGNPCPTQLESVWPSRLVRTRLP